MSIFRIYVDGQLFYHPEISDLAISEAKLTEDAENIDSFTLSAPHDHPYISLIRPMASVIVCKKGDQTVFEGRALDDGSDFYNTHTWTCESSISYLRDSQQPPYDYSGTLKGLLEKFISVHNEAVEEKKRFTLGSITVTDKNDYIAYSNSEYSSTLDAIRSKLIDTHGGYLMVRYEGSVKYLDYLAEFNERSVQTVEYGKNLTDVKISRDHTERVTALIPLGAKAKKTDEEGNETETEERINISSVNDGKNYVCDEDAVKEIGWIWASEIWDDVTKPGNLLTKARARIATLSKGVVSMELTIVDESDTGADIGSIHARQYVDCKSEPHGIDGRYPCINKTTDYLNPSGNTITIGASGVSLTSASVKQNKNITAISDDLIGKTSEIRKVSEKSDAAGRSAAQAIQDAAEAKEEADSFKEDISVLQESVTECYSEISKSSEEISLEVRKDFVSRTEMSQIQKDFQTSITQSSSEIRMDFTQSTDEIKNQVAYNKSLMEEYIRFKGALIELGKIGNAFTAELSNDQLAFKENGQTIAFISNQSLVITNAEIRYKLSLGDESRGWFDFIPRVTGNLSVKWRGSSS